MKFTHMLNVVDAPAEGESGKLVVGSVSPEPGETIFDKQGHPSGFSIQPHGSFPNRALTAAAIRGRWTPIPTRGHLALATAKTIIISQMRNCS
jgi:hypothetical protein